MNFLNITIYRKYHGQSKMINCLSTSNHQYNIILKNSFIGVNFSNLNKMYSFTKVENSYKL